MLATAWFEPEALQTAWVGPDGRIATQISRGTPIPAIPAVIGPRGPRGLDGILSLTAQKIVEVGGDTVARASAGAAATAASNAQGTANSAVAAAIAAQAKADAALPASLFTSSAIDAVGGDPTARNAAGAMPLILPTNGNDCASALSSALASAAGRPLRCPSPNATYRFTSGVSITGLSANIDWNGAAIEIVGDFKWLSAKASFTAVQNILAVTNTQVDLANGTNATLSDVAVLSVSNAAAYAPQDIVKVVSDDQIIGTDPTKNRCRGEFATVAAVNTVANTITLFARLRMTYATNPRVAKLNRVPSFSMMNGKVVCTSAPGSSGLIDVIGFHRPVFSMVDFANLNERAIRLVSCYEPTTWAVSGANLNTSVANDAFGYLIHEVACFGGRHWGLTGRDVRHVYSCSAATVSGSASPFIENYGINYATKVFGGRGVNCKAAAFETHDDGENIDFIGCHAESSYWGEDGNQCGFSFRGRRNRALECTAIGGTGYRAFSDYASSDNSRDHSFVNCQYTASTTTSQENRAFDVVGMSGGLVSNIQVTEPRVFGGADTNPLFEVSFGDMQVSGGRSSAPQTGINQGRIFEANASATMRVRNHDVDYTGATGTQLRFARLTSNSARIDIEGGRITDPSGALSFFADFVNTNATFYMGGPKGQNLTDMSRSIASTAAATGLGGTPTYYLAYTVNWGRTAATLDRWTANWGTGTTRTIDTANRGFPELMFVVAVSAASNSVTDINAGAYDGQKLTIYSAVTSSQSFTVANGNNIELAVTQTIAAGGSITFRWSAATTKWQKV